MGGHGAGVGIGARYLVIRSRGQLDLHGLETTHLLSQGAQPLPDPGPAQLRRLALLTVGGVQRPQVALDAGLRLLDAPAHRGGGEVLVARVHRLEAAAVHRHDPAREQAHAPADRDKGGASPLQRLAVVAAEVGDGLEVRDEPARQPHQLGITPSFTLQLAAGLHLVK